MQLVTGSAGFVARHLLPLLDGTVVGLDRAEGSDLTDTSLPGRVAIMEVDTVFHLAAEHFVPWCRLHPTETQATNVGGLLNLLAGLERHPPRMLVAASSAAVYGLHPEPRSESDRPRPVDVYGWSKLAAEVLLMGYAQRHPETTVVAARLANVVGPDDTNDHVVPVLLRARAQGRPAAVGNVWPLRDYIHVDDVATALVRLTELPPGYHIYNVGTGRGVTVSDVAKVLDVRLEPDPNRERADDGHLVLDVHKIGRALGWHARRPLASVLEGAAA